MIATTFTNVSRAVARLRYPANESHVPAEPKQNDNPYSESQFKTMKYTPLFPRRFGSIQDARSFCRDFFDYYNHEHRHSRIGLMTPATFHFGQAEKLTAARQQTLLAAHHAHPERFVRGTPQAPVLPPQAWINPPPAKTTRQDGPGGAFSTSPIPEVPPVSDPRDQFSGSADLPGAELRAPVEVH